MRSAMARAMLALLGRGHGDYFAPTLQAQFDEDPLVKQLEKKIEAARPARDAEALRKAEEKRQRKAAKRKVQIEGNSSPGSPDSGAQ